MGNDRPDANSTVPPEGVNSDAAERNKDAAEKAFATIKDMASAFRKLGDALDVLSATPSPSKEETKRAICLGGGGPAAGLHIGALEALESEGIKFTTRDSVWALSCIGAWVGVIYNQAKEGNEIAETYKFFEDIFRRDDIFKSFPVNTVFAPDLVGNARASLSFLFDPKSYLDAFLPEEMLKSLGYTLSAVSNIKKWKNLNQGDFNRWLLNHVMAVHPVVRFLAAWAYKSDVDGRTKLFYPNSSFIKAINFKKLQKPNKPYIFYNAFNFEKRDVVLFGNKWSPAGTNTGRGKISAESLCACSALPFIEQTVKIDGKVYCEGALVDTVNFRSLLEDHAGSINEIWINRIVDSHQVKQPRNLHDGLANLCELFAATVGEDDIKLFKLYARENFRQAKRGKPAEVPPWSGTIVTIQVDPTVNFHWDEKNLKLGRECGSRRALEAIRLYKMYKNKPKRDGVLLIPDDLSIAEIKAAGVPVPADREREAAGRHLSDREFFRALAISDAITRAEVLEEDESLWRTAANWFL